MVGTCECGNEIWGFQKLRGYSRLAVDCWLLRKDSAPWNSYVITLKLSNSLFFFRLSVIFYGGGSLRIAHLCQQCHNSKFVIFQEKRLRVLKCYNFLWVQRRHNFSPAAGFANCVITTYLLKVHLQTFLSIPITQKMPKLELWHSCRKWAIFRI